MNYCVIFFWSSLLRGEELPFNSFFSFFPLLRAPTPGFKRQRAPHSASTSPCLPPKEAGLVIVLSAPKGWTGFSRFYLFFPSFWIFLSSPSPLGLHCPSDLPLLLAYPSLSSHVFVESIVNASLFFFLSFVPIPPRCPGLPCFHCQMPIQQLLASPFAWRENPLKLFVTKASAFI